MFEEVTADDRELIGGSLERWKVAAPPAGFRKLVAGRRLWNFQQSERETVEISALITSEYSPDMREKVCGPAPCTVD